jgi:hypothetical protein
VLAYHLLVSIEKTLLDQNIHISWATIRETVKIHRVRTIVLPTQDDRCLRGRNPANLEPEVQDLYARLKLSANMMNPIST